MIVNVDITPKRVQFHPLSRGPTMVQPVTLYASPPTQHCCDTEQPRLHQYSLRPCTCNTWVCPHCAIREAKKLKAKVLPVLMDFKDTYMITLTLDQKSFPSAQAALEHIRKHRAIGTFMKRIRTCPFHGRARLHSDRYIWTLEFQENGWPHYHVVLDASYVKYEDISRLWQSVLPGGEHIVFFSKSKGKTKQARAWGAMNYLLKMDTTAIPDWVRDYGSTDTGRVTFYKTSHGFYGKDRSSEQAPGTNAGKAPRRPPIPRKRRPDRTIRERLEHCGEVHRVIETVVVVDEDTGDMRFEQFWQGDVKAKDAMQPENIRRHVKQSVYQANLEEAMAALGACTGTDLEMVRSRPAPGDSPPPPKLSVPPVPESYDSYVARAKAEGLPH